MDPLEFVFVPLILFMTVVAPIWIIAHYITRWRQTKTLSGEDEKMLADMWESASRMDSRINALERILDSEAPDWRKKT